MRIIFTDETLRQSKKLLSKGYEKAYAIVNAETAVVEYVTQHEEVAISFYKACKEEFIIREFTIMKEVYGNG